MVRVTAFVELFIALMAIGIGIFVSYILFPPTNYIGYIAYMGLVVGGLGTPTIIYLIKE